MDYTGRYICLKFDILHRVTNWFSLVPPKTQTYAHWTDFDLFNLPEAFYNNRGQKELSRGGRDEFEYMWMIMHDLQPVLAGVGVNGLSDIYCSTVTSFYLIRERELAKYMYVRVLHSRLPYYTLVFWLFIIQHFFLTY